MLTRREAAEDIRMGRGIKLRFVGSESPYGRPHTFDVIVRQSSSGLVAVIDCHAMGRAYSFKVSALQVLAYIKLHYQRNESMSACNQESELAA